MKKPWLLLSLPLLGVGIFLTHRNLPENRHARHVLKARQYASQNNLTAAQMEYEAAFDATGGFTPYADLEVLKLMNRKAILEGSVETALGYSKSYVERNPRDHEGRLILAELAFRTGDLDAAFESVNAVLEAEPDHAPALLLLARARARQGRLDLAETQLRRLYETSGGSPDAILPLAENLLAQGRGAESRALLQKALALHPDHPEARLLLAEAFVAAGEKDSVAAVLAAWRSEASPDKSVSVALRKAQLLSRAGLFAEADSALAGFRGLEDANLPVLWDLAVIKTAQGQYDSASALYARLGEAVPGRLAACRRMSLLLNLKSRNPARALETAMALKISEDDSALTGYIAAAYRSLGQDHKLERLIAGQAGSLRDFLARLAGQLEPDKDFIGQWALTEYYRLNERTDLLIAAAGELNRRWPRNALAAELYAGLSAAAGRFEQAARLMEGLSGPTPSQRRTLLGYYEKAAMDAKAARLAEKMLREDPAQPGLNRLLGDQARGRNQRDRAAAFYEKELAIDPGNPAALRGLAWEYGIVRGDTLKARPYLDAMMALKDKDAGVLDAIGWLLARQGKAEEGERYVREALDRIPDSSPFLYHLAWIKAQAGDREAAEKLLEKALESKAPFEERKDAEALHARRS